MPMPNILPSCYPVTGFFIKNRSMLLLTTVIETNFLNDIKFCG